MAEKRFGRGVPLGEPTGRYGGGAQPRQQTTSKVNEDYQRKIKEQKKDIEQEIAERRAKIAEYNAYIKRGASKTNRSRRKLYIRNRNRIQGEVDYLEEALKVVEGGSALEEGYESQAASYAKQTTAYLKAKQRYSDYKKKQRGESKLSKEIAKREGISLKEAIYLKQELRNKKVTITKTDLPAEQRPTFTSTTVVVPEQEVKEPTLFEKTRTNIAKAIPKPVYAVASFIADPLKLKGGKFVGGTFVRQEKLEKLSPQAQRLAYAAQPENILLMAQYPTIKQSQVVFKGVKTTTKEGNQITTLKYKTSTGKGGQAIGVTKKVGGKGNIIAGKTEIIGVQGDRVVDLTRLNPKMSLIDKTKFGVRESSIAITKNKGFVQLSAGKIASKGKIDPFQAVDIGKTTKGTTYSFGVTGTKTSEAFSLGKITDVSKLKGAGTSVSSIGKAGTSGGTTSLTSTKLAKTFAQTSTQAGVRAAVGTEVSTTTTIPASLVTTRAATIQKTSTTQLPRISTTPDIVTIPRSTTTPIVTTRTTQLPQTLTRTTTRTTTKPLQAQSPISLQRISAPQTTITTTTVTSPIVPTTPKTPRPFLFNFKQKQPAKFSSRGFDVQVKRGGKFRTIGRGLTFGKAFSLGAQRVQTTAARTFKLKGEGKLPKFTTPKFLKRKKRLTFVEKQKFAISTKGELLR